MNKIRELLPADFPAPLQQIPDPPETLYVEGVLPSPELRWLTVVGSRKCSRYGQEVCEHLISNLAGQPVVVVSGLALGIDTIAHKAALRAGLPTVAVPGSGLGRNVLHPHSNRRLADTIVERGGALLSEFPTDYPAGVHTFPRRNRIMAGLSRAVLIIEANEKSGTLITARLALDYNRDVLAVPGSIFSPLSQGTIKLIRQGATPVGRAEDILEALGLVSEETVKQTELNFADFTPLEQQVITLLQVEPRERDELIRELNCGTAPANVTLMNLEVKGIIVESAGHLRLT